jgi:hypothetical protein
MTSTNTSREPSGSADGANVLGLSGSSHGIGTRSGKNGSLMSRCKDCEPGSKRPAPHPGPRCATHHREFTKIQEERAFDLRLQRTYGITADVYWQLYEFQGGTCYICRWAKGKTKRLCVDHDHETGEVRGLLCNRCNRMVGFARDSSEYFQRAADYLINPPYKRMKEEHDGTD